MKGSDRCAWSTLRALLAEKKLTVVNLHEILRVRGLAVNRKSLYRLASLRPVQKVDTAIVRGICEALDVRLEELIQFEKPRLELARLEPRLQEELDMLIEKNNDDRLTGDEETRFNTLVNAARRVMFKNLRVLSEQNRGRGSGGLPAHGTGDAVGLSVLAVNGRDQSG